MKIEYNVILLCYNNINDNTSNNQQTPKKQVKNNKKYIPIETRIRKANNLRKVSMYLSIYTLCKNAINFRLYV